MTGNLRAYASGDSRWVHNYFVIAIPTVSDSLNLSATLKNSEGDAPINVSSSIYGSALLVIMNDNIVKTRSYYRDIFRPCSYN